MSSTEGSKGNKGKILTGREVAAAAGNQRRFVLPEAHKDEDGKYHCRWCGAILEGKRRSWCGMDCVKEYWAINDPSYIAKQLLERDGGVCACCGVNAERLALRCRVGGIFCFCELVPKWSLQETAFMLGIEWTDSAEDDVPSRIYDTWLVHQNWWYSQADKFAAQAEEWRREAVALGFPDDTSRRWWEADHIVEVVRGGGCRGLENYQTLCIPCHKAKTRRLAKERAAERRRIPGQVEFFGGTI